MNRRASIVLLCIAAVALACGRFVRLDSVSDRATGTTKRSVRHARPGTRADSMRAQLHVAVAHDVQLRFDVVNSSGHPVEVKHPTGQRYDLAIFDSAGREVWRWSASRMFTQAVRNTNLRDGDVLTLTEAWATPADGRYVAVATLRSTNFPIVRQTSFVVGRQQVVSR